MVKLSYNYEKIFNNTGRAFEDEHELFSYMEDALIYLSTHNKNYTRKQYYKIEDLREILANINIYDE